MRSFVTFQRPFRHQLKFAITCNYSVNFPFYIFMRRLLCNLNLMDINMVYKHSFVVSGPPFLLVVSQP